MEQLDGERQKNIERIENILDDQSELREKDQAIFNQVCQTRDHLQNQMETKDFEISQKE